MFDRRYEFAGHLQLLSPLHIGSGAYESMPGVDGKRGANETPQVARIVKDIKGEPYIPATTIKGLLRRLGELVFPRAEMPENDVILDLFGAIKDSDNDSAPAPANERQKHPGVMGALLVRGGALLAAGETAGMPYVDAAKKAGGDLAAGTFVAARTAIDPLSGVAADAKLFFQETVAPGAKFKLRLTLIAGDEARGRARLDAVVALLSQLAAEDGVVCGRGKADGAGRLRLAPKSLRIDEKAIDRDGNLVGKPVARSLAPATRTPAVKRWRARFCCEGPFASLDSSWEPEKQAGAPNPPQLAYQQNATGAPLELGSQLAGVLRARARWIAGLKALEKGDDPRSVDPAAGERVVVKRGDVARLELTAVERLFGVTGYAGLLRIEQMRFVGGAAHEITSVKLDHFSGAPIDKALFTTRVVVGARLEISLALEARRDADPDKRSGAGAVKEDDDVCRLFDELKDDLRVNGLTLGHGANKGFGWFEFEKALHDGE